MKREGLVLPFLFVCALFLCTQVVCDEANADDARSPITESLRHESLSADEVLPETSPTMELVQSQRKSPDRRHHLHKGHKSKHAHKRHHKARHHARKRKHHAEQEAAAAAHPVMLSTHFFGQDPPPTTSSTKDKEPERELSAIMGNLHKELAKESRNDKLIADALHDHMHPHDHWLRRDTAGEDDTPKGEAGSIVKKLKQASIVARKENPPSLLAAEKEPDDPIHPEVYEKKAPAHKAKARKHHHHSKQEKAPVMMSAGVFTKRHGSSSGPHHREKKTVVARKKKALAATQELTGQSTLANIMTNLHRSSKEAKRHSADGDDDEGEDDDADDDDEDVDESESNEKKNSDKATEHASADDFSSESVLARVTQQLKKNHQKHQLLKAAFQKDAVQAEMTLGDIISPDGESSWGNDESKEEEHALQEDSDDDAGMVNRLMSSLPTRESSDPDAMGDANYYASALDAIGSGEQEQQEPATTKAKSPPKPNRHKEQAHLDLSADGMIKHMLQTAQKMHQESSSNAGYGDMTDFWGAAAPSPPSPKQLEQARKSMREALLSADPNAAPVEHHHAKKQNPAEAKKKVSQMREKVEEMHAEAHVEEEEKEEELEAVMQENSGVARAMKEAELEDEEQEEDRPLPGKVEVLSAKEMISEQDTPDAAAAQADKAPVMMSAGVFSKTKPPVVTAPQHIAQQHNTAQHTKSPVVEPPVVEPPVVESAGEAGPAAEVKAPAKAKAQTTSTTSSALAMSDVEDKQQALLASLQKAGMVKEAAVLQAAMHTEQPATTPVASAEKPAPAAEVKTPVKAKAQATSSSHPTARAVSGRPDKQLALLASLQKAGMVKEAAVLQAAMHTEQPATKPVASAEKPAPVTHAKTPVLLSATNHSDENETVFQKQDRDFKEQEAGLKSLKESADAAGEQAAQAYENTTKHAADYVGANSVPKSQNETWTKENPAQQGHRVTKGLEEDQAVHVPEQDDQATGGPEDTSTVWPPATSSASSSSASSSGAAEFVQGRATGAQQTLLASLQKAGMVKEAAALQAAMHAKKPATKPVATAAAKQTHGASKTKAPVKAKARPASTTSSALAVSGHPDKQQALLASLQKAGMVKEAAALQAAMKTKSLQTPKPTKSSRNTVETPAAIEAKKWSQQAKAALQSKALPQWVTPMAKSAAKAIMARKTAPAAEAKAPTMLSAGVFTKRTAAVESAAVQKPQHDGVSAATAKVHLRNSGTATHVTGGGSEKQLELLGSLQKAGMVKEAAALQAAMHAKKAKATSMAEPVKATSFTAVASKQDVVPASVQPKTPAMVAVAMSDASSSEREALLASLQKVGMTKEASELQAAMKTKMQAVQLEEAIAEKDAARLAHLDARLPGALLSNPDADEVGSTVAVHEEEEKPVPPAVNTAEVTLLEDEEDHADRDVEDAIAMLKDLGMGDEAAGLETSLSAVAP